MLVTLMARCFQVHSSRFSQSFGHRSRPANSSRRALFGAGSSRRAACVIKITFRVHRKDHSRAIGGFGSGEKDHAFPDHGDLLRRALVFSSNVVLAADAVARGAPSPRLAKSSSSSGARLRAQQGRGAQRLSDQISERRPSKSLALTRPRRLQNGPATTPNPRPVLPPRPSSTPPPGLQVTRSMDKDLAPRCAAPPHRSRFRHQGAPASFDDDRRRRSGIKRGQAARGYPATGYLNKLQHTALQSEIVSTLS